MPYSDLPLLNCKARRTPATPSIPDTTKFEFGRYYKFDIPAVVKDIDANDGVDIENTANQTIPPIQPIQ